MGSKEKLAAIETGRAWADLRAWRKVLVSGAEARAWLHDLVTASVEDLEPGDARRSLLLTPTGRIRADFLVAAHEEGFLLAQDPVQPEPIEALLSPYVLSAAVELLDRTEELRFLAFPNREPPAGARAHRPSATGPGHDALPGDEHEAAALTEGLEMVREEALEAWRIARGAARFPRDLPATSLPHEAGLDHVIAFTKGCFLGQEAVAKVRNLGHPPWVVLALRAVGAVSAGEPIVAAGEPVGEVTSAAPVDGAVAAIGRVRWAARASRLATPAGEPLEALGLASGAP